MPPLPDVPSQPDQPETCVIVPTASGWRSVRQPSLCPPVVEQGTASTATPSRHRHTWCHVSSRLSEKLTEKHGLTVVRLDPELGSPEGRMSNASSGTLAPGFATRAL